MDNERQATIRERLALVSDQLTTGDSALAVVLSEARLQAGLAAYERARADGLCHEGAWECALEAMQALAAET